MFKWGNPPTFGAVCCDDSEIFVCEGGQGGRGSTGLPMTFGQAWSTPEMHVRHPDGHVFRVSQGIEDA